MSQGVVLADTNILSYIYNKHSHSTLYEPHLGGKVVLISAQTLAEMRFGAFRRNWGATRLVNLETFLSNYTAVYPNDVICKQWARLRADAEIQGKHLAVADAWVAATAVAMDVPLITHNKKDFAFLPGLTVISEG